jgi:hypothetical protein
MESARDEGVRIGMLLDLDAGSMTVYRNGVKLGVMQEGLGGAAYSWTVVMYHRGASVRLEGRPNVALSAIDAEAAAAGKNPLVDLQLVMLTGTSTIKGVLLAWTVGRLNQAIADQNGVAPDLQMLVVNNAPLEDDLATLSDCGVSSKCNPPALLVIF